MLATKAADSAAFFLAAAADFAAVVVSIGRQRIVRMPSAPGKRRADCVASLQYRRSRSSAVHRRRVAFLPPPSHRWISASRAQIVMILHATINPVPGGAM